MLKKIEKETSFLNRISNFVSATRCVVHESIVAPYFEYCATLIINMGETKLAMLRKAQIRAMRVTLYCHLYQNRMQALQFMSIKQRLYYNVYFYVHLFIKYQIMCYRKR